MVRVTIIGGGPAGASAAIALLASAGRERVSVRILESRAFPRSKVCGEFISPAASGVIERLIGSARLNAAGARVIREMALELDERRVSWTLPTPAWAISRATFDELLIRRAAEIGGAVWQPACVVGVDYRVTGAVLRLSTGEVVESDVVIHADGSGRHDLAGPTPNRAGVVALKCWFRPRTPVLGVRMRAAAGGYVGTIAVDGGRSTVAMVVRANLLKQHGADPDRLTCALWPEYEPAMRDGAWLSCGVADSGFIASGHARSFRIGNAAGAVEPVGGEGIGLALWSGELLGRLLGESLARRRDLDEAALAGIHARFALCYRARLRTRRLACRLAAEALMRPALLRTVWPLVRAPRFTIAPWYRLTGKPAAAE